MELEVKRESEREGEIKRERERDRERGGEIKRERENKTEIFVFCFLTNS